MTLLNGLAPFVPLGQTLLWFLLVIILVVWFRRQIRDLLRAVQQRIESGSGLKAGPFELFDQIRVQSPETQRARATSEAQEALAGAGERGADEEYRTLPDVADAYLLSEDLAIRAIQAEYGVPAHRQATVGPGLEFDAVVFRDADIYVVEVKLILRPLSPERLRLAVLRVGALARQWAGPKVKLALVLVFIRADDKNGGEVLARQAIADIAMHIDLWTYSLPELRARFGVNR